MIDRLRTGAQQKMTTFAKDPRAALKSVWARDLRPRRSGLRRSAQMLAKHRLAKVGVLPALETFTAMRPDFALPPDYCDLLFLYRLVRDRKPTVVLEFGSGCSTAVISQALWQNAPEGRAGRIYSIEADAFWADATAKALPHHLDGLCQVVHSPVLETERFGVPGFRHEHVPDVAPDFVYIDGPTLTEARPAAFDVFDIEPNFQPGCAVVVDGRPVQALLLRKHLTKTYRATESKRYFNYLFELT